MTDAKQVIGGPLVIGGRQLSLSRAIRAGDFVFLTGQIPIVLAAILVAGALPGAQIGSALSHRTRPVWLRLALAIIIAASALGISFDLLFRG